MEMAALKKVADINNTSVPSFALKEVPRFNYLWPRLWVTYEAPAQA
jgi:hypothetical protein